MSEVLLPTWIIPEEETQEWLDEGSSVFPSAFAPGIAQRQSFGGLRLKMSRRHTVRAEEKAQLLSILRSTKGQYNALRSKVHFALRGSGFGGELVTNGTFANGTTGWTAGSGYSISAADRSLRAARSSMSGAANAVFSSSASSVTQYAPYAARAMIVQGRGAYSAAAFRVVLGSSGGDEDYGAQLSTGPYGLLTLATVLPATSAFIGIDDLMSSGLTAGDYFSVPYVSLSRCALVDNGPNAFLQSDTLATTWSQSGLSAVNSNVSSAPDGTITADSIVENSSNSGHYISQSIAKSAIAQDWCVYGYFARGSGTRDLRLGIGIDGSNIAHCIFDLGAGTKSAVTNSGTITNGRAFIEPTGNGYYFCCVVGRLTTAVTAYAEALLVNAGSAVYTGNGTSSILGWRVGGAQSSLPTRGAQTTTTALASGTSQTGSGLHLKGLPASVNGLLLPEDVFEINGELKTCTAALNSDAAGLGYLQFEPALVRSPSDNDPVIVTDPMGKFLVSNIKVENQFGTQAVVTYDLEHIYE